MKLNEILKTVIISFILITIMSFTTNKFMSQKNGTIGDVKYSILSPDDFFDANGCGWVLLNGKELSKKSELFIFLSQKGKSSILKNGKIPNADGVFIRTMDTNPKDDYGDLDAKTRKVGQYVADTLKSHTHDFYAGSTIHREKGYGNKKYLVYPQYNKTTAYGGKETRPKSISLYTYIKINNSCN